MEITTIWLAVMAVAVYLIMEALKYFGVIDGTADSNKVQNAVSFVLSLLATGIVAWQTDPIEFGDNLLGNVDVITTWVIGIWGAATLLHHRVKDFLGRLLSGEAE